MNRALALIPAAAITLAALTACGSAASSSLGGPPPPAGSPSAAAGSPSAAAGSPSAAAAAPSASASTLPCDSHSCVVSDLEQNLDGLIAQDEAVVTKAVCYKSTVVFHAAADTWSASCTVTFSDGSSASGTGNLDLSQQKVTFTPAD